MGSVLQSPSYLGALAVRADAAFTPRVCVDFEALSTNVREHRHRDRQCSRESRQPVGATHCTTVSPALRRAAVAGVVERTVATRNAGPFPFIQIGTDTSDARDTRRAIRDVQLP